MALTVCPNCEQWQRPPYGDCTNECAKRGFAPFARIPSRPDDEPEGKDTGRYANGYRTFRNGTEREDFGADR